MNCCEIDVIVAIFKRKKREIGSENVTWPFNINKNVINGIGWNHSFTH